MKSKLQKNNQPAKEKMRQKTNSKSPPISYLLLDDLTAACDEKIAQAVFEGGVASARENSKEKITLSDVAAELLLLMDDFSSKKYRKIAEALLKEITQNFLEFS